MSYENPLIGFYDEPGTTKRDWIFKDGRTDIINPKNTAKGQDLILPEGEIIRKVILYREEPVANKGLLRGVELFNGDDEMVLHTLYDFRKKWDAC